MKLICATILLAALSAASARAADPLASLRFLIGTWKCTYEAGKTPLYYRATYSSNLGSNWLQESDSWAHGGGDLGMFTYEPNRHGWTAVVMEDDRSTVVFFAKGSDPNHVVYRSIYPNGAMTDVFDRQSATHYTLHFTQSAGHKSMKSTDVCVKT